MTDTHRFAMSAERFQGELWNVTLLPIERAFGPATNETGASELGSGSQRYETEAKLLENLDEGEAWMTESGASRLRVESESISASFEGQLEAVGW
jgi:hypothetical protein